MLRPCIPANVPVHIPERYTPWSQLPVLLLEEVYTLRTGIYVVLKPATKTTFFLSFFSFLFDQPRQDRPSRETNSPDIVHSFLSNTLRLSDFYISFFFDDG